MSEDSDDGAGMAEARDGWLHRLIGSSNGLGGLIAIAIGCAAIAEGLRLDLGTLRQMGPGAVPLGVGVALVGLGLLLVVPTLLKGGRQASVPFSLPILLVLAALAAFAVLLPAFGLVPATLVLMLLGSLAITGRIRLGDVIYAAAISALAVLVFIKGLGLVLPIIRWPF